MRWMWAALLAGALLAGVAVGVAFAFLHRSSKPAPLATRPAASWPSGAKRAPEFALRNQDGRPISLASMRGKTVLLTFIDPVCQSTCPLEAKVVTAAAAQGGSPAVVAVSVNPWGNARAVLRGDIDKWRLGGAWRWAVGSHRQLARVWKRYAIGVRVTQTRFRGATVRSITHTEACYVIDRNGYVRALYVWPFQMSDVAHTIQQLS